MKELIEELKTEIIDVLNLEVMTPAAIDENAPLFGEGLGLANEGKEIFKSVKVMAEYIKEHRTK